MVLVKQAENTTRQGHIFTSGKIAGTEVWSLLQHNHVVLSCHSFYSCDDLNAQLTVRLNQTNNRPMRPLNWLSPIEFLKNSVQYD